MFKFLKEKISSWTKSITKEEAKPKEKKPAKQKKVSNKKTKSSKKQISKELEIPHKIEEETNQIQPDLETLEEQTKEPSFEVIESKPEPKKKGFFQKLKEKITNIKITQEEFNQYKEELEMLLLENNVAFVVTEKIIDNLEKEIVGEEIPKKQLENKIKESLKKSIEEILVEPFDLIKEIKNKKDSPYVILFCGINGSGKTTTIAKFANLLKKEKISCILAAGDTFRAAAIDQLKKHAEKLLVPIISADYGSDPASVGFDAISYAKKNKIKCVLIDTAGRMYTQTNLMQEIGKISRVCKPDCKIFIGESITGNDATEQVKTFNDTLGIDGIILSKADVDEKGGTALSVGYITNKPILYLGVGQEYKDLEKFDKKKFIEKLGL